MSPHPDKRYRISDDFRNSSSFGSRALYGLRVSRSQSKVLSCSRSQLRPGTTFWRTRSSLSILTIMAVFQNKKFRSAADANTFAARYRAAMAKHPFLLFGLPFMSVIIAGSFVLTPATAIRYEKHDRKVRQMTRDEELGVGKSGRRVDMREEYYVSSTHGRAHAFNYCWG